MPKMVQREKWVLYKHTCKYDMIKAVAVDVKNNCKTDVSKSQREAMQDRLADLNLYSTRNPTERPLDSINHRINTLEFWMFGYETSQAGIKKFIFSPLGNLFLKHLGNESKLQKIFVTMLFALQFQHPATAANNAFHLFPFRLVYKLLLDPRLDGKLYNNEFEYLLVFLKDISVAKYEELVRQILYLRSRSTIEMASLFKQDEHTYVNAVYEWEYYTTTLLEQIGVLDVVEGDFICYLYHPSKPTSKSLPTKRKATRGFVQIPADLKSFITILSNSYSCFDQTVSLEDDERLTIDCIKEIYNFYPNELLKEIGEQDDTSQLLKLPQLIEAYSNNPENDTAYLFEEVLTDGFNMFYNVEAKRRGGAAHTDIECLYLKKRKKFAVESKSTANKLLGINAGRLREHRKEIGGEYTIVITPRYVPATKRDIEGSPIVIILASTFAEYLYNNIANDVREIDYADFDDIITHNLGKDISQEISNMTIEKFAAAGY